MGNEGDIGLNPPRYEDTSYHGYEGQGGKSDGRTRLGGESYEMDEYECPSYLFDEELTIIVGGPRSHLLLFCSQITLQPSRHLLSNQKLGKRLAMHGNEDGITRRVGKSESCSVRQLQFSSAF